jgi:prepilin-type N-terminal cleavage/methylation domain-containing protein
MDSRGFTAIELIVTLVVTSLLIALTFWIAHPKDYAAADANAARWTGVSHIMQALRRYQADNGVLPARLPKEAKQVGNGKDMINLCAVFVPKYMKDIPLDPVDGGQYAAVDCRGTASEPGQYVTGYTIMRTDDNTVTVAAPSAEDGQHISLSYKF